MSSRKIVKYHLLVSYHQNAKKVNKEKVYCHEKEE